jgi:TetR/AcrR family transcriptional regulator, transcriptional repressor for nem operon
MSARLDVPRNPRDPEKTRERILDAAQALILEAGFGATTVDAVVGKAGITKGAFFHHFASKSALGQAVMARFAAWDQAHMEKMIGRAEKLADDPLQQLLTLLALYQEMFETEGDPASGCLFASYIYEKKLFNSETIAILQGSVLASRALMRRKIEAVVAKYPPRRPADLDALADMFYVIAEGAYVVTKTMDDRTYLARQTRELRNYFELLFEPR